MIIQRKNIIQIKNRFDNISLETCVVDDCNRELVEYLKDYIKNIEEKINNGENLIITGDCGVGKTYLMKCFINDCKKIVVEKEIWDYPKNKIEKRLLNIGYFNIFKVIEELRKKYEKKESDYNFNGYDILIIDEIGVQFATDGERQILYEVINYRWENFKPTFLISNLNLEGIKKVLGLRIFDRINTNKHFILNGSSRR
jgi:DNA replication protein DnaC